jgi:hypothetical protein
LASSDPLQQPLGAFLDDLAAETSAPGAGTVAAITVALGAALVEMAARFSEGAEAALTSAAELRSRVTPLAQADGEAYVAFLAARRAGIDDAESGRVSWRCRWRWPVRDRGGRAGGRYRRARNPNLRGEAVAAAGRERRGGDRGHAGRAQPRRKPDDRLDLAREHAASAAAAAERAASAA